MLKIKMNKISKNEKGFSVIELVLVLVIVVLIGAAGWLVYKNHYKTTIAKPTATSNGSAAFSSTSSNSTNTYSGWKQYCDSVNRYCLKYPSNWKFSNNGSSGQAYIGITNISGTLSVGYTNPNTDDGFPPTDFYTSLIYPLSGDSGDYTIIGGYWTSQINSSGQSVEQPFYALIDSSYLKSSPLVVGQISKLSTNIFTNANASSTSGSSNASLTVYSIPSNGEFATSNESTSWLNSQDAQTALLILKSFSRN